MSELDDVQRRALCRLYRALAELKGVDASNPSEAAELKARAAMEGVGLVIDLPPAGGVPWSPSWPPSSSSSSSSAADAGLRAEESATLALASAAESAIDATFGAESPGDEEENTVDDGGEEATAAAAAVATKQPRPPAPRPPLTYVMLLRGLFDTQREEALALIGGGGGDLLKGMAVRRLPQAMAPVLRMVANLRGICAHLVRMK